MIPTNTIETNLNQYIFREVQVIMGAVDIGIAATFDQLYGTPWSAVADNDNKINLYKYTSGSGYSFIKTVYTTTSISSYISVGFDTAARPVTMWEQSGVVHIHKDDGSHFTFNGHSPRVLQEAILRGTSVNSDTVCIYMDTAGKNVMYRSYHDDYATENTLYSALDNTFEYRIVQVVLRDKRYEIVLAYDDDGRTLFKYLLSELYPLSGQDKAMQNVTMLDGELLVIISLTSPLISKANQEAVMIDGEVIGLIAQKQAITHVKQDLVMLDGALMLTLVIDQQPVLAKAEQNLVMLDGELTETIVTQNTNASDKDKAEQNVNMIDGEVVT